MNGAESSSTTTTSPATESPTPSTTGPLANAFNYSVSDQQAINALLRVPLPNVLADMVMDYLFHPLFDLWEEIVFTYESLPRMPLQQPEDENNSSTVTSTSHQSKSTRMNEPIELMPKLQLSPPASPMEVDELEQLFQLKYDDPNFHFSSELKFLWSIADGLEASQNMIFRGRFWPSLTTMRAILECHENSYYVMWHYHSTRSQNSVWLKYDFYHGVIYATGSYAEQSELFTEDEMVIIFHSLTHFFRALLATLKLALSGEQITMRYPLAERSWNVPHPPAIRVAHVRGIVPQPPVSYPIDWTCLLMDECVIQSDEILISGHLTPAEYFTIREEIWAEENRWAQRQLNRLMAVYGINFNGDANGDGDAGGVDASGDGDKQETVAVDLDTAYGFPIISSCHLLDELDGFE